ncbi:ATP-binding cassette sub-family G member 1-like isoform X2 [Leptotrombidium deliense]|uniref:ATP-binding cassette sub-family G member 1-like isoform X2 n=1 Tax=Leptotrombidium deliense TaxID=299467 RepID=A0A443SNB5_9ACAR|nr:ATP-binding cassette sub-family G member 1-like isoform X2 [Leptotrombidium deliense]
MSTESNPEVFHVFWDQLKYTVRNNFIQRKIRAMEGSKNVTASKTILKEISGQIHSGEMTALMGPSGAGKSTLLEILVGIRRPDKPNNVMFRGKNSQIDIAFIPQNDEYFDDLTVNETLIFASKLKNATINEKHRELFKGLTGSAYHEAVIKDVCQRLGLEQCRNVQVKRISGGQKKRLSVAQELVSKPDILILDEPTSGLDSTTAFKTMTFLASLTRENPPITVVCTIHQPNPETFNLFDRVYVLSKIGKCIYEGKATEIVEYLKGLDIHCPNFYNPADYIVELAAGEYGIEAIDKLVAAHELQVPMMPIRDVRKLKKITVKSKHPFFRNFFTLYHRSNLILIRDKLLMKMRVATYIGAAFFLSYLYGTDVGKATGCPALEGQLTGDTAKNAMKAGIKELKSLSENMSLILISVLMMMLGTLLPVVITTPHEFSKAVKEKWNNWYGIGSFHLGMVLSDLPFELFFPTIYLTIIYILTEQAPDLWRYLTLLAIFVTSALIGYSIGMTAGTVFMDNIHAAIVFGPIVVLTLILFSGLVVRIQLMPLPLQILSKFDFLRYVTEGLMIALYGFGRCGHDNDDKVESMKRTVSAMIYNFLSIVEKETNGEDEIFGEGDNKVGVKNMTDVLVQTVMVGAGVRYTDENGKIASSLLSFFELYDEYLYYCGVLLIVNVIAYRLLAYIVMIWKSKARR